MARETPVRCTNDIRPSPDETAGDWLLKFGRCVRRDGLASLAVGHHTTTPPCMTSPSSPPSPAAWPRRWRSATSPSGCGCRRSSATCSPGSLVGPYTPGFVADTHLAEQLAEVGVILLMFGVGLQFHLEELLAVRRVAVPGAVVQSVGRHGARRAASRIAFGWGWPAGIVFGMALSVASTVVLVRVLADNSDLHTPTGPHRRRLARRRGPVHGRRAGAAAGRRSAPAAPARRSWPAARARAGQGRRRWSAFTVVVGGARHPLAARPRRARRGRASCSR